jgi:allantoinase
LNTSLIYSERCFIAGKLQPASISFTGGKITDIHFSKLPAAEDLGNAIIMPGVIDAHVHINEPGRTEWEGFETATQAAAAGGISTIVDMPLNASPVTTTAAAFAIKLAAAENKLHVNVGFYGGLVPGNINDLEDLIKSGVLGIKCFLTHSGIDEFPNVGRKELEEAMPIIARYGIPVLAHCELYDEEVECDFATNPDSYRHYLASRPKQWENDAVALMIELCRKYNCRTHIVHVSSAESLEQIADAKKEGLPLTAETCPHYIYFHAENIPDGNTLFKCAPPIREKDNNELLKNALVSGVLDFITTDHSPAPHTIKQIDTGDLLTAWGGISSLQFLLAASYTAMKDKLTLEQFIPLLTEHPAVFLKLDHRKGFLKAGYDADIVVWNPEDKFTVREQDILHRHTISPYIGEELNAVVQQTIINGVTVFKNTRISDKSKPNGESILANNYIN